MNLSNYSVYDVIVSILYVIVGWIVYTKLCAMVLVCFFFMLFVCN